MTEKMRISIISFTRGGYELANRLAELFRGDKGNEKMQIQVFSKQKTKENAAYVTESLQKWTKVHFDTDDAIFFIGACGIAVRAVAPFVKDKLKDPAVLVLDEKGEYVIPLLSGHVGGANELAKRAAEYLKAVPVITTATDVNGVFAVDAFAKKNRLVICSREGIAKVSAKILEKRKISFAAAGAVRGALPGELQREVYPPEAETDFLITPFIEETKTDLTLCPQVIALGIGCKAGKTAEEIEGFVQTVLNKYKIRKEAIKGVYSIDKKKDEAGILDFCKKWGLSYETFFPEELGKVTGNFTASAFVKSTVGMDNVCERAALLGCGTNGKIIIKKQAENGITAAMAMEEWSVDFDE